MALNGNSDYDPYASPYRSNSYLTGAYGDSGGNTLPSQQNATNQSAASQSSGNDYLSSFSNAAGSWGSTPRSSYFGLRSPAPASPPSGLGSIGSDQPSYGSPSRPGVHGTIGQPPSNFPVVPPEQPYTPPIAGRQPGGRGPQSPQAGGYLPQSSFTTPTGQPDALRYYQQWLPNLTLDQLGQYWGGAGNGQRLDDWWHSAHNQDGTSKTLPMPVTGGGDYYYPNGNSGGGTGGGDTYRFVPGYGWTNSDTEYAAAQGGQQGQGGQGQPSTPQSPSSPTGAAQPSTPSGDPSALPSMPGAGYTPSAVAPPAPVQFPSAPGGGTSGLTNTAPGASGTPGAPTAPGTAQSQTMQDYLRGLLAPQFHQEQSDLNRQMLATGAQTGDLNSGGFAAATGKEQARLAANQGSRLTDYLTQASEAEKNRALQTYQIDTSSAIAKMQDETSQFGIRTNDDLQRYLNSQNNTLAKYGIDKNDVLQRYVALMNANHQSAAAMSAYNAAALQAATQQAIAEMNNKTAQQNSQNQYNLGVLGINADNYRSDSNNLLSYLNLMLNANPQAPVPQIPGVVGYGP